jgi:alpha-tubulin suppressor-like RCC1 family protein
MIAALFLAGCGARSELDPEGVRDAPVKVRSIALGLTHGCAVLSDGTAACWGNDLYGQLGDVTEGPARSRPVHLESPTDIASIAGGNGLTCAVLLDGTLECWGAVFPDGLAAPPTPMGTGYTGVSTGIVTSCAVRADGGADCWGDGEDGQLGDGTVAGQIQQTPGPVLGLHGATAIAASGSCTCALVAGGSVMCWGAGLCLGHDAMDDSPTPAQVQGLTAPAVQIAVGDLHACALLADGTVSCWGNDARGLAPAGWEPMLVPGVSSAKAISAGTYHSCAVLTDGTARCWGTYPTLPASGSLSPAPVPGLEGAVAIASGQGHDCALLADGRVVCWGDNSDGQLGDGTMMSSATPVEVVGLR